MASPKGKERRSTEKGAEAPAPTPVPKTPWELVIVLLWQPPWRRWFILVPLVIAAAAVNLIGREELVAMWGLKTTPNPKVAHSEAPPPVDSEPAGVRVRERSTTLDLKDWKEASSDELARNLKIEAADSKNTFLVVRTDLNQVGFIHRVSSSSGIEPVLSDCNIPCKKVALAPGAGRLRQWNVIFDIRDQPIDKDFAITFNVRFWNSFQRRDQWWGGFRILHSTEKAVYAVAFPDGKRPKVESLQFAFAESASQKEEVAIPAAGDLQIVSEEGLVKRVSWKAPNPQPDRSYRIYWTW